MYNILYISIHIYMQYQLIRACAPCSSMRRIRHHETASNLRMSTRPDHTCRNL